MKTVADQIVERLRRWGVERVFGYAGDAINGLLGALQRAGNEPEFVQARHEEMAAFMACGYAKFAGKPGVCLATSGPGAIHLLNGLYDAKLDHQPVVAVVGQQKAMSLGGHFQQEVDLASLFKDVAGAYVHVLATPEQAPHLVDRAMRVALAERTVTCVIVPHDLQNEDAVDEPPREHGEHGQPRVRVALPRAGRRRGDDGEPRDDRLSRARRRARRPAALAAPARVARAQGRRPRLRGQPAVDGPGAPRGGGVPARLAAAGALARAAVGAARGALVGPLVVLARGLPGHHGHRH
ncbi:MAG TPA: thiamine pyrophosphate-binding protein, partial [Polyangiaceae bacterium]|nr:thiamine pyrophosphate-binding protein [Polyangiaceae bacterium]